MSATRTLSPVGVRSWSPASRSAASYQPGASPHRPWAAGWRRRPWSSTQNGCSAVAGIVDTASPASPSTSTVTSTRSFWPWPTIVATTYSGSLTPASGSELDLFDRLGRTVGQQHQSARDEAVAPKTTRQLGLLSPNLTLKLRETPPSGLDPGPPLERIRHRIEDLARIPQLRHRNRTD